MWRQLGEAGGQGRRKGPRGVGRWPAGWGRSRRGEAEGGAGEPARFGEERWRKAEGAGEGRAEGRLPERFGGVGSLLE